MNLESRLDKRLWDAISGNIQSRNFTGAILDAIHLLGELIRDKSGLEADGAQLIGQALGGENPKLRISRMQTESEINIQRGTEALLRGVYQGIRNPRSHEKYNDSQNDAEAIILFVDFLIRIIDQSRTLFVKSEFINRVLDDHFPQNLRYAELLVNEIPAKHRLDVFYEIYRSKANAKPEGLKLFFDALLKLLGPEELRDAVAVIGEELKTTDDESDMRLNIRFFSTLWPSIPEIARIRVESRLIKSIETGRFDSISRACMSGGFGTWATRILKDFSLKGELMEAFTDLLRAQNSRAQDYLFEYFFDDLGDVADGPGGLFEVKVIEGLRSGDKRFRDAIGNFSPWPIEEWSPGTREALKEFKPSEFVDDDIPF
jgi:uncharacterized protein (TIGR02391 family)